MDAVLPLQRRPDDQAAAAGDDGRAARAGRPCSKAMARAPGVAGLDAGRHAGGARADDGDVGLVVLWHLPLAKAPCLQVR